MSGDIYVTIIGNLVADPELRFTPAGAPVANFTVACNSSYYSQESNDWVDNDPTFLNCNIWRNVAENVAETLRKGDRVIVHGRLQQRSYENNEGEKRTIYELAADEVGASLRFVTAELTKTRRDEPEKAAPKSAVKTTNTNRRAPASRR